ncbi:MAG: ABC transporter substrate-binding protein [Paenibacillaceae bacterium]|nr:MAG: ABC transporter substrate-binding protein [Paenibacillaceae bacterium]
MKTRHKRRKWKIAVAGLAAFMLLMAGCQAQRADHADQSGDTAASGSGVNAGGRIGGELTYALATSPDSLDPHRSGLAVAVRVIRTIHDSLIVQDENGEVKPWLATSWEISEDGLTYTFKLREDVKFHDGTPFNAEAVKYNFDRILDPETKAKNSVALLRPYESSEVVDVYTIRVRLFEPSSAFLGNLSQALLGIVSPTAAEKYGEDLVRNPVGTGPFKFVSWSENASITVERNEDYHWAPETVKNAGAPYLDRITFHIIPEEATRIGSVQGGQVLAAETVPPQNIPALEHDAKIQIFKTRTNGLPYTLFINQTREPWNELKARQALLYGVDVDAIIKSLYLGTYERAWSPLAPGMLGYNKALENSFSYDPARAAALLDELGWKPGADGIREKDGKKLALHYVEVTPNREKRNDIAAMIQQQLKQIGIAVEVEITKDYSSVVFQNGNYDLYGNSQVNSDPEALRSFYHSSSASVAGKQSLSGLKDPVVDRLLDEGNVETDTEKRIKIYERVQQEIMDRAAIIPIYVFPYTVAASRSVSGLTFDYLGYPIFNDVVLQGK